MRVPPASESSQTVAEVRESLLASCCSRCVPPLKKKSSFVHCSGGSRVARDRRIFVNINDDFLRISGRTAQGEKFVECCPAPLSVLGRCRMKELRKKKDFPKKPSPITRACIAWPWAGLSKASVFHRPGHS